MSIDPKLRELVERVIQRREEVELRFDRLKEAAEALRRAMDAEGLALAALVEAGEGKQ